MPTGILVFIFPFIVECFVLKGDPADINVLIMFYDSMAFGISLLGKMSTALLFYCSLVSCTIIRAIMTA